MGNNILKTSGIFLLLAGLLLVASFIMELLTGTLFIGVGIGASSSELYTIIFALSEIFPQVLVAYTLEVFALLVCIPGLVGVAVFLNQESRRKWFMTLVLTIVGMTIILFAVPTLFNGLLSAYHLTASPPAAAIPGITHSASGDIAFFLALTSVGCAFLIGGGGGTIARFSKSSIFPRSVRILGYVTAIIGLLLSSSFFITYQVSMVLVMYKIAVILFSVWILLLGVLILRYEFPRFEINKRTRIAIILTGVFGIAVYTAEILLLPMITEPSSIDNLLAHLQSGASFGSFLSIFSLIIALLLIPSLYTIHRTLVKDQNILSRISMTLMIICATLVVCISILQLPLFGWAEWYNVIIDSSIYGQFQEFVGVVVTTIRTFSIASVFVFSLGLLLLAYNFVKTGPMGSRGSITSIFAILGLALTGLLIMEPLIAFPTIITVISQIILYTFILLSGVLFLKLDPDEQTATETTSINE
ncbi:hypothetical protein EU528_05450 [Candidatus Thorarchaeota archaeon]|nr:MAG: hypothetical protein EU528_05450 [Candidatus Thorarchaeota archaeon]